ncbi:MAG: response regulator [Candidatus Geothermincolia bacterium]
MPDRVLIIEDEQTVAEIISINLQIEAFEVEVALNGTTGLAMARQGAFDIIICDIMMPDIDGYEICRQLKADRATRDIPIILLTARTEVENKLAGLEAGADDYITKPFNFADLIEHINMNLDRAASKYTTDPLTGLPGNIHSDDALREMVISSGEFSYMLVSVNNLRPFRDVYGIKRFEDALRFASHTLTEALTRCDGKPSSAYYLGGGNFSALSVPAQAERLAREVVRSFDSGVTGFYTAEDLSKGCVTTFDRRGAMLDNPLMTVSIGIASNGHREIKSHWEAAEIAREVLEYAMTFPGSKYVMDRRTEPPGKK